MSARPVPTMAIPQIQKLRITDSLRLRMSATTPVADEGPRAVTASSAVPVLFNPVVVRNYPECGTEPPAWMQAARTRAANNPELAMVVDGLETYFDRENRQYAHFVDGGITDNLGLRAVYEIVEVAGGVQQFTRTTQRKPSRRLVVISVDAATKPEPEANRSTRQPSLEQTIDAVSSVQLHRYNAATLELMQKTTH